MLGVPPLKRKRDHEELPIQHMRPTKRGKVLRQPDAAPTATPKPPPATHGGNPPRNQAPKRKPPTRSSPRRAQAEPANQSSLRPPAAVPPMSPPTLKRKSCPDVTNGVACPVEGQGRHLAKRGKSQQVRDATHRKDMEASTTRSWRGKTDAANQTQPKKQAVPEPRRSARIAALPPRNYR